MIVSRYKHRLRQMPRIQLPVTMTLRKVYIFPTRQGFLFILILIGMLLGSLNYNNNLGFLLTFLLGSMTFVSIFHTHRNLSDIRLVTSRIPPVFAGEQAVFELIVQVKDRYRAFIGFGFLDGDGTIENLSPGKQSRISLRIPTTQRGIFRPEPLTVFTQHPLGLFRAWTWIHLDMEYAVYPRPHPGVFTYTDNKNTEGVENGESETRGVDDFSGLKLYQPGDSLRRVSWKAYSKGQGLFTKDFIGQSAASVVLDWDRIQSGNQEQKLSRMSDLVLQADKMDLTYQLKMPLAIVEYGKGEAHKHKCLYVLAKQPGIDDE